MTNPDPDMTLLVRGECSGLVPKGSGSKAADVTPWYKVYFLSGSNESKASTALVVGSNLKRPHRLVAGSFQSKAD